MSRFPIIRSSGVGDLAIAQNRYDDSFRVADYSGVIAGSLVRFLLSAHMDVDTLYPRDVGCLHLSPSGENVKDRYRNRIELLQGTLDLLVLQTLRWGPQHGYGISRAIQSQSGDILRVDTGSLYPALHRLERKKWIAADWKTSENKQRVRVYRLTAKGRTQLADERSRWNQFSRAIAGILNAPNKEFET